MCSFLIFALILVSAYAEGLLPGIEDVYGVPMPSLFGVIKREPDEQNILEDGTTEEVWYQITDNEYESFGEYLSQSGCELVDYTVEGSEVTTQVGKEGKIFSFIYNSAKKKAVLMYPKGTFDNDLQEIEQLYTRGLNAYQIGDYWTAYSLFSQMPEMDYKDVMELRNISSVKRWDAMSIRISAGYDFTVGLKSDGTVLAAGSSEACNVSNWTEIIAISAGEVHTVGLKSDGTVVATGQNWDGICDVSEWKNIMAVSAGSFHTVGLKTDGTVVAIGNNEHGQCNVSKWRGIVAVSAGTFHTVGLKENGTVVAVGDNDDNECQVSDWTDIIAVSAGHSCTLGLKKDGTVVATGLNNYGQCNVSKWNNIVAISAKSFHTAGLKENGTVVTNELTDQGRQYANYGQHNVTGWKDIVAISVGDVNTIGLKSDGRIIVAGRSPSAVSEYNEFNNVGDWSLWNSAEEIGNIYRFKETRGTSLKQETTDNNSDSSMQGDRQELIILSIGAKGEAVKKLQESLIRQGYLSGKADGDFGKKTDAAVRAAQKDFGMEESGIADELFQKKLYEND